MGREQQLSRELPIDQRVVYEAVSYTEYRTDIEMRDATTDWYLRLPPGSNPRTTELAQQMFAKAGSQENYVDAVLRKFHQEEYYYTLEPPALGNNPVDSFLFNTQQGFCEHYASAFAVMMRSVGIPARIVLGYQGGELNPKAGHLIVRQSDAHAWTEVWMPGIGWYRVDPTAAVAPERIDAGMSGSMLNGAGAAWGLFAPSAFLHDLGLSWDAINAKWNDLVLGYGPDKQNELMQWLGMNNPDWRKMMLTMLGLVIAMVILISLLLAMRYRPPRPDRAAILYKTFVNKTGITITVGESPASFAARARSESALDDDAIDAVTTEYLAARYGAPDEQSLQRLQHRVSQL